MEAAALEEAFGHVTEGGVLEDIAHIGSTSVPGLSAKPCIDIMARVYPLPIPQEKVDAVTDLGYEHQGERSLPGRHYFRKGPHDYHLHVVSLDTDHWPNHLVFRNYLRASADARNQYETLKRALAARYLPPRRHEDRDVYQEGKAQLIDRLEHEAFAWHVETTGFSPVREMARGLEGLSCPWLVGSGWALDLFVGEPSLTSTSSSPGTTSWNYSGIF